MKGSSTTAPGTTRRSSPRSAPSSTRVRRGRAEEVRQRGQHDADLRHRRQPQGRADRARRGALQRALSSVDRLPEQRWDYEPGVVYDVNVYAVDFMHNFGDVARATVTRDGQGGRARRPAHGGIGDARLAELDRREQLVTALFKARLFMTAVQWSEYKALSLRGLPADVVEAQADAFAVAEVRFAGYLDEMFERIDARSARGSTRRIRRRSAQAGRRAAGAGRRPRTTTRPRPAQENILMTAANRIYEDKLAVIRARRAELKAAAGAVRAQGRARRRSDAGRADRPRAAARCARSSPRRRCTPTRRR